MFVINKLNFRELTVANNAQSVQYFCIIVSIAYFRALASFIPFGFVDSWALDVCLCVLVVSTDRSQEDVSRTKYQAKFVHKLCCA